MNAVVSREAGNVNEEPFVLVEDRGPVRWITLNRGRSYNPLSLEMIGALHTALDEARDAQAVRCIVIRGDGRGFSAGHDLREVREHREDADGGVAFFEKLMGACSEMMTTIVRHPQPVIACVDGVATAAGAQLVASCDLAYASEGSRFATPGVNIGLFCSTPMVALTRNVAAKHAMEMLLTGEMIDTDRAADIGLINRAVAVDALEDEVARVAEVVAGKSMHTLQVGKEAFSEQRELSLTDAYAYTSQVMVQNLLARDADEGISAFLEKRAPTWEDR